MCFCAYSAVPVLLCTLLGMNIRNEYWGPGVLLSRILKHATATVTVTVTVTARLDCQVIVVEGIIIITHSTHSPSIQWRQCQLGNAITSNATANACPATTLLHYYTTHPLSDALTRVGYFAIYRAHHTIPSMLSTTILYHVHHCYNLLLSAMPAPVTSVILPSGRHSNHRITR